jgi:predicted transcriptional regulator
VTLRVGSLRGSLKEAAQAAKSGKAAATAYISFASAELLWAVMTANRWEVLKAMAGAGELTIREIATRVGRDVKAVHRDVQALLHAGVLEKSDKGRAVFPYEKIRVDFELSAVA